jgi:hypothetical protein
VLQNSKVYGDSFKSLNESTVRGWYEKGTYKVKKKVFDRWKEQAPVERGLGSGKKYVLEGKLELETKIKSTLEGMREAGLVVNSNVAAAVIRGLVEVNNPELLGRYGLSRRWCRRWMNSNLSWSYRKGTTSGQKLPAEWKNLCDKMLMRAAVVAAKKNVTHPALIINWDQTGLNLIPSYHSTFGKKGDKQIPIAKMDDKRQITAVVASNAMGELLPVQLVWTGVQFDKKSGDKGIGAIPKDAETKRIIKEEKWHMTQTDNHWSSEETMKDYITLVIHPFIQLKTKELKLKPNESDAILVFDCWATQIQSTFMDWLKTTYPKYHPIIIPANCTGVMQPADVFLQKPLKDAFRNQFTKWSTTQYTEQIKAGTEPSEMKLNTSLKTLKPLVVEWIHSSWKKLNQEKQMIRSGWNSLGYFKILDREFQREALIKMSEEKEEENENEVTQPIEDDEEDDDEGDCSDEDEDSDIIASLASCLEGYEMKPTGRRSSRVQQNSQLHKDERLARAMEEQTLNEFCYLDDDE